MSENKETTGEKKLPESETPHKQAVTAVTAIAACAFGCFCLGSLSGAPWPAAVASCGLSAMGVGVAYVMLRRA